MSKESSLLSIKIDSREAMRMLFPDLALLARLESISLSAGSRIKGTLAGKRRSSSLGGSQEFADYRPYAPGDDIRRLDWNVYGRTGRAYIRQYWDEQELNVSLYIDVSRSMSFGEEQGNKLRYSLQLAACIGYAALSGDDRIAVKLFGEERGGKELLPLRGRAAAPQLFQFLAAAMQHYAHADNIQEANAFLKEGGAMTSIAEALEWDRGRPRRAGTTWLITDAMYEQGLEETLLTLLAAGQQVVFIHVLSTEEYNPSMTGELKLIDSELGSGKEVALSYSVLAKYRETVQAFQEELKKLCGERGITYIFVDTSAPIADTVLNTLLQANVLRSKA